MMGGEGMDPAILFMVATFGGLCVAGYALRTRYLANLPLQVSRLAIRRQRGADTFLLFRARLGRGRCAERPCADVRFCVDGGEALTVRVKGPSERLVGPWTFRVPVPWAQWGSEVVVEADVHVQEGGRTWSVQHRWRPDDVRDGAYRSLCNLAIRPVGIDRPDWEEVVDFSADHVLGKCPPRASL